MSRPGARSGKPPGRRDGPRGPRAAVAVVVAAALLVGAAGALAGPASAGDTAGALSLSSEEFDVEPGETVTFEVAMTNDGERADDGVYGLTLRLDYPTEYLTVTEVESAGWFREAPAGGSRSDVEVYESVDYDDERGAARLVQSLDDPGTGVTGSAAVATVTVRVEPDAEPAVVELGTRETSTELTSRRDYPQPLATPTATFNISGGGNGTVVAPTYDEAAFSEADGETGDGDTEETGANESDGSGGGAATGGDADAGTDGGDGATGGDTSDGETGDEAPAPVAAAVLGVLAAAVLLGRR